MTDWIDGLPDTLPPVRTLELADAWSAASAAAAAGHHGPGRVFRFRSPDSGPIVLSLSDRDALCWAAAAERHASLDTRHGLAICLRLLALIDLLARNPALRGRWAKSPRGAPPDMSLLRAAANAPLTTHATFDEREFLHALPMTLGAPVS